MSGGGRSAVTHACVLSDRFAAIAPVMSVHFCRSEERPVPMIVFHGSKDPVALYEGGTLGMGLDALAPLFVTPPIEEAVAAWADRNGCASPPVRESVSENVVRISYEECEEGATVELYNVLDGGHTWPGGDYVPKEWQGHLTQEISATDLIWDFFLEHPMP